MTQFDKFKYRFVFRVRRLKEFRLGNTQQYGGRLSTAKPTFKEWYICLLATSCLTERIKCSVFCKFSHCNFQTMRPIIHCFPLGCKHVKIHRTSSLLESTVDQVNFPPLLALAILLISGFHLTTQLLYVTPRNQSYKCRFSSPVNNYFFPCFNPQKGHMAFVAKICCLNSRWWKNFHLTNMSYNYWLA